MINSLNQPMWGLSNIQQGEIAKVFGAGGGTQIQLGNSLKYYEVLGLLKEVIKWIRNKLKNSNKK